MAKEADENFQNRLMLFLHKLVEPHPRSPIISNLMSPNLIFIYLVRACLRIAQS